jgi:hypothetical protein
MSNGAVPSLVGAWAKSSESPCADRYPDSLTFAVGTYRGARGGTQGFVCWDAGSYRLEDGDTLVLTTATDELVRYRVVLTADELTVADPDGCVFAYRRLIGAPPAAPSRPA